ncbi:unnamed protein product [Withania somnifera]
MYKKEKGICPPEVSGAWPIIGHLRQFSGNDVHLVRKMGGLTEEYGPIFTIQLGVYKYLVISSWEAVKDCFTIHDKDFAARPASCAGKYLGYDNAMIGFAEYGPYWRKMRKLVLQEILSNKTLEKLKYGRISEVDTFIKELYSSISMANGEAVNISDWFEQLTLNIIVKMIAGKKYTYTSMDQEAQHFKKVFKKYMYLLGEFVLVDVVPIPFLNWVDYRGRIKLMKQISKEMDIILQNWLEEHVKKQRLDNSEDFIDVILALINNDESMDSYTREKTIKAMVLSVILDGFDTISVHLTWLMTLIVNNKHVMKRAQEEIDKEIGRDRWVEENDIKKLVYLQAIVKETLRLYPPAPLLFPHEAMKNCNVGGYFIPKGCRLIVNAWKLHRDTRIWTDNAESFIPERFLSNQAELSINGQHFEYVPFGSGRRTCPGIIYATQVTHLTLARLLQAFNFSIPFDRPVDMLEGVGITLPKANPLQLLITPRLSPMLYEF